MKNKLGLLHIYHGDGKGKSTAAMGLALRAAGRGLRVVVAQFLKDDGSGELELLRRVENVQVYAGKCVPGFLWNMDEAQRQAVAAECEKRLAETMAMPADVLILDEALDAQGAGMLPEGALLAAARSRGDREMVLTGRGPDAALCAEADYITKMVKQKHPSDRGMAARVGVEL